MSRIFMRVDKTVVNSYGNPVKTYENEKHMRGVLNNFFEDVEYQLSELERGAAIQTPYAVYVEVRGRKAK